eukprot:g2828.t1
MFRSLIIDKGSAIHRRQRLAEHVFHGVPDVSDLRRACKTDKDRRAMRRVGRATAWKLLLDYLSWTDEEDTAAAEAWTKTESKKREDYRHFIKDFDLLKSSTRTQTIVQNHELTHGSAMMTASVSKKKAETDKEKKIDAETKRKDTSKGRAEEAKAKNETKKADASKLMEMMLATDGEDDNTNDRTSDADDGGSIQQKLERRARGIFGDDTDEGATETSTTTAWRLAETPRRKEEAAATAEAAATKEDKIDEDMRSDVVKDVLRTMPGLAFFNTHRSNLERLLYLYSKLNPGISYVQGMNELLAPLYYVMAHDTALPCDANDDKEFAAEADAFWCFQSLMNRVSELYTRELDVGGSAGISGCISKFEQRLREVDPQLFAHLQSSGIRSEFYAFRWLVTLNSREFELPDVLCLWDAVIADQQFFKSKGFIYDFCVAMLVVRRDALLRMSFTELMSTLQRQGGDDDRGGGGCGTIERDGHVETTTRKVEFSEIFDCALELRATNTTRELSQQYSNRAKINASLNKMMSSMKSKWLSYRRRTEEGLSSSERSADDVDDPRQQRSEA